MRPTLPVNLAQPCQPVPLLENNSWDGLALAHIELAIMYGECAARHAAVVRSW
ncbi:hypothetical protein [Kerstersia gyiorum]|uniref:hypothetical protein n=1 Tax=Kerstersia gyiorum TaxID=206506 RepID=UPI003C6DADC4